MSEKCAKVCQGVPSVPTEDGNSVSSSSPSIKTGNALYKYDFVLNNYTEEEVCQVCQTIRSICKKGIFGKEIGENNTPHLQGYISLKKKERITGLAKLPGFGRAHFGACRNEKNLIDYCQKDGDIWSFGFPKPIKILTDLYDWQKKIEDIFMSEPDDRTVHWFWENTGNIGKSAFTKYMVVKHKALFCAGGKYCDIMNLVFNQDMDECRGIIFDIPRSHKGHISYASLESIKNGMVCNTKYETGVKIFNAPHVIVFANFIPDSIDELSADRWKIVNL